MKPNIIRQLLLKEGYFLAQIPPVFTSGEFAEKSNELPVAWQKEPESRMLERYSLARPGLARRDMQIPNPVNQFYVADVIANNWQKIRRRLDKSKISESTCEITRDVVVGITPHKNLAALRLSNMAGRNHVLKTDITLCFPSIYTHSIAWACHGKKQARANHGDELFGNQLDVALRRCNEGKSVGIPIGPRTSHIIAEIVMSAIDVQVAKRIRKKLHGYRHVDDYFLCFDSDQETKRAFAELQSAAAEYELVVSATKTNIYTAAEHQEDSWPHQLRAMASNRRRGKEREWLTHFVSESSALAKQYPNGSVMKYALAILGDVSPRNWGLYQSALLHILHNHPYAMDKVAQALRKQRKRHLPLNTTRWTEVLTSLIARCAPLGHHSEVAWALWLAKVAGFRINQKATMQLPKVQSSICALLALDCRERKLLDKDKTLNTTPWREHLSAKGLKGPCWLLAYEAPMQGWLGNGKFIDGDPFFSDLKKRDVMFYCAGEDDADEDTVLDDMDFLHY